MDMLDKAGTQAQELENLRRVEALVGQAVMALAHRY